VRLDLATWLEVEEHLKTSGGIILPTGSTEQHGPMGLIGTDAICAEKIAEGAGERASALIAPTLAYTPAPFNMLFPGTISISPALFETLVAEIVDGLGSQGFGHFYFLNGHGANLAPLRNVVAARANTKIRIRSWWDFEPVNKLRQAYYADWEGMHATPSEVAITQATHRVIDPGLAATPPEKLTAEYIRDHSGDRHGPPGEHRQQFPDGRVGSHSALASPEHGRALLAAAIAAVADDYRAFLAT
jgi:creatinine amidohydrolase